MIYYYRGFSVYELDFAIPRTKNLFTGLVGKELQVLCDGRHIGGFLAEKLQNVTREKEKEKQLCLKIVELCQGRTLRCVHVVSGGYDGKPFAAELEVGKLKDWAKNNRRPYSDVRDTLREDLGEGVVARLCEGKHGF